MATTSLRIYLHDIEGMVGAGQTDEAISHCMHILQTFPKNIAVYRLLGKAYLETQRYSDAADIFQRVLSAVPDDFISNVGMSIIREDEGNLDGSIWHMERAFETQPYNSAIQDELRRLYGRRDGMEPPKIRLTRGSLARMYMKGSLHQQAIGELRAALAEDPQRLDLQALLARVYYLSGQRIEAVETCSTLLKKLPYCMDANLLLGAILPETERAQDAQNYRQRVISLEPYFTQASSSALTADNVAANAVMIEKLDYIPGKPITPAGAQPSWATSLGVAFKEQKEEGALPEWLASPTVAPPEGESAAGSIPPFQETGAPGAFPWEPTSGEAAPHEAEQAPSDTIPDWMKEAGWGPSTGEAQEAPLSLTPEEEEPTETPVGAALVAEDIPDWLREAAPPGVLDQTTVPAEEKPLEEALPWLQENPPGPTDTIMTWLSETKGETPQQAEEIPAVPSAEAPQPPEEKFEVEIPDWLKETAQPAEAETPTEAAGLEETPDWMKSAEPAVEEIKEEELPDWLKSPEAGAPAVQAELPDWLETKESVAEKPAAEGELFAATAEEMPDWLKTEPTSPEVVVPPPAPAEAVPAEAGEIRGTPPEVTPAPTGEAETTPPAEEYPSWLKEVEAEIPDEAIGTPQLKGVTDWLEKVNTGDLATGPIGITDWLSNVEPNQEPPAPQPGNVAAGEVPEWLEGILAAKQTETGGAEEQPTTQPEAELPEWLETGETRAPEAITPSEEVAPAIPAEEIPEWMKDLESGSLGAPVTPEGTPAEAEVTGGIPPSLEAGPVEAAPALEGGLPPGVDLSDQEVALAWLEGLAARQGVPEEELITKPEERAEFISPGAIEVPEEAPAGEVPDWLKEVGTEAPEVAAPMEEAAPAAPAEEVPDWLKEVGVEAPEVAAPMEEAALAAPVEAVPEWLKEVEAEAPEVPEVAAPTEEGPTGPAEEVPEWLKEVKAEGPEAATPAIEATPAAPAAEVPDWLKEVEAEVPEEAALTIEPVTAEAAPPVEAGLPAGLDLSDQDAALAWLEGLAARQGAPEEELITRPEERAESVSSGAAEVPEEAPAAPVEEVPAWLKEAEAPQVATPELTITTEVEEAPSAMAEETPEWLKEVEAEVPEGAGPLIEPVSTQAAPPAEAGLPAGLDLSDQEAALAWLESLAAKQGAPEEELITRPEERAEVISPGVVEISEETPTTPTEEVPEWLKEVEAEAPQVAAPEVEETPAAPFEAVPEWLKEVGAEAPQEAAPEAEVKPAAPPEAVPEWLKEVEAEAPQVTVPEAEITPAALTESVPEWLKSAEAEAALEATITGEKEIVEEPSIPTEAEAPGVEIPAQPTEWIKEAELPQWQEKVEVGKPEEKAELEAELPGWIAEVAAEETELAWVPPQAPEPEEKAPERNLTNVNTASVGELERLPGIGFVLAQSIINHRESRGFFARIEDLLDVPGIGSGTIDVLRDWITVEPVLMEVGKEEGAIPLDPDHVILKHAHDALQQGDISTATKQYDQLLSKMVLLNEIILDLQDALYRYPVDITIWQSLGDAYMRNNQLQDALDAYTKAEELLR